MHPVLLLVALAVPATLACVASGVCGGGGLPGLGAPLASPCFSPIPPVSPGCSGGCSGGYSCGAYGCYRARARVHSAMTYQQSPAQQGPILLGASRFSQFRRQRQPPTDPNALFMQCCEQRGLPDACLARCTFNTFTKDSLTRMYFQQDGCPLAAAAEIQYCAAQGRDHRECCVRNGVATTIAGAKCLTFCDQRPGNVTQLDFSYAACYDRFDNMKSCFWHDITQRFS